MDLKDFDFPVLSGPQRVFASIGADPQLLAEAKARGFDGDTPYNKLFSKLFFGGGKIQWKPDIDPAFKERAWPYCLALMGSFEPKHEHKEAICAMLMSELLLPELAPNPA